MTRVTPLLEAKDVGGLISLVRRAWTSEQIVSLLTCEDRDARKVAALALSLVGDRGCLPSLVRVLRDPDPTANQMAEHALWSIWFRLGTPDANHQLVRGTQALGRREVEHAIEHFTRAIELCPDFAEAYNQRGMAAYLIENFEASADDCRRAVELNPDHFGAWSGLGHCCAYLGLLDEAVEAYERALEVNPHLECVRELRDELLRQRD